MSYLVLARKWRPQTFRDLIGQEHVNQTLKNAIESGRIAHAFLFTGGRGVGKTSAARILAKTLNCERGPAPEPCNVCSTCLEITAGNSVDVFEIDGASNTSVDDIRELRETVKYLPSRCRYKIFIIDEVHMLSTSAFNALLKTLEEPPSHVKFIFATTEPHKVPITILSRCQRFDFKRISLPMIVARLRHILDQEKVVISDAALSIIARKGDGSMRDSLSTLDQVLAFCGDQVADEEVVSLLGVVDRRLLFSAAQAVLAGDCPTVLDVVRQVDLFGCNMRHFCQELIDHFRSMTILKAVGGVADLSELSDMERVHMEELTGSVALADLQRHLAILLKAESDMAHSGFARLIMEMALLKMATLAPMVPVDRILERLKALELRGGTEKVASEQAVWTASSPPNAVQSRPAPQGRPPAPVTQAAPTVTRPVTSVTASPSPPPAGAGGGDSWTGFVAFVKERKAGLSSLLEHGRPIRVGATELEIGFPEGSYYLKTLREPDYVETLKRLANLYFNAAPALKLVAMADGGDAPASLVEKKSLEAADQKVKMQELAENHPLVVAALAVFGGELGEVRPDDGEVDL